MLSRRLLYVSFFFATNASPQWRPADQRDETRAFSSEILSAHNQIRARVAAPPLTWSSNLAARAQEWASHLWRQALFYHRPNSNFGENIFVISGAHASPSEVVGDWASEERDYNYHANTCRGVCGHYTQIVWRATREIGCAVAGTVG